MLTAERRPDAKDESTVFGDAHRAEIAHVADLALRAPDILRLAAMPATDPVHEAARPPSAASQGRARAARHDDLEAGIVLPMTRPVALNNVQSGPLRREPDQDWRPYTERIAAALHEVHPMTVAQWEEGFCHDMHPEREIIGFLSIIDRYQRVIARRPYVLPERKEIYRMILMTTFGVKPAKLASEVTALPEAEARAILRFLGPWPSGASATR